MGKRSHRKPLARQEQSLMRAGFAVVKAPIFWIALTMIGLVVAFIGHQFALNDEMIRAETVAADLERRSPDTAWDSSWPPLQLPTAGAARPMEQVQATYAFAARRPDILRYIPCYCGCEHHGHRSNEDCYIRSRASTGVPQWDPHSFTCEVCLGVTRDVIKLHAEGKSVGAIREAIDALYMPRFRRSTPTPKPPE